MLRRRASRGTGAVIGHWHAGAREPATAATAAGWRLVHATPAVLCPARSARAPARRRRWFLLHASAFAAAAALLVVGICSQWAIDEMVHALGSGKVELFRSVAWARSGAVGHARAEGLRRGASAVRAPVARHPLSFTPPLPPPRGATPPGGCTSSRCGRRCGSPRAWSTTACLC